MAETFATLKARLADWLNIRSTTRLPDAVRGDALNLAINEMCRDHDLWFCDTTDSFPTVAGTHEYDLPARWVRPYRLWYINDSGSKADLIQKTKEQFDFLYPTPAAVTGDPQYYAWWGETLYLGPTPDSVITIYRNYYRLLADMSAESDSNVFTDNAWSAAFYKALVKLAKYLGQENTVMLFQDDASRREEKLAAEHRRARSAGRPPVSRLPGTEG